MKYEYKVFDSQDICGSCVRGTKKEVQAWLDGLGQLGWRLVAITLHDDKDRYHFEKEVK
tara:strand:- start:1525 stop:1701 length:177 start_codon:yes stop_codon:yes gene_type:complete